MRSRRLRTLSTAMLCAVGMTGTATALTSCSSEAPKKKVASTCPPSNPKPSRSVPWSTMYANVYNASDNNGQAKKVAERLKWRGLNTLEVSNDPLADEREAPKYAEIRYGAMARTIALNLAQQIPHANLYLDSERSDATVDIVIGNKFELTPQAPRPIKDVSVEVYNTTFFGGLAADVSSKLAQQGFKAKAEANDRAYYPDDTAVVVYDEEGLPDAQRVALSLKGARLLTDTKANVDMKGRTVRVYLGSKWPDHGAIVPLSQATPKPTPSSKNNCS